MLQEFEEELKEIVNVHADSPGKVSNAASKQSLKLDVRPLEIVVEEG